MIFFSLFCFVCVQESVVSTWHDQVFNDNYDNYNRTNYDNVMIIIAIVIIMLFDQGHLVSTNVLLSTRAYLVVVFNKSVNNFGKV